MSRSSTPRSQNRPSKERPSESLERSIHSQDESFVHECKAAYISVADDISDRLTSRHQLELALQQTGRNPTRKVLDKYWTKSKVEITFDEFCQICKSEPLTTEDGLVKAFRKIDSNGDGFITHEELCRVMTTRGERMSRDEVKAMIDEVDTDKDGKLDYKEFSAMILSTTNKSKKSAMDRLERREKRKVKRPSSGRERDPSPRDKSPRSRDRTSDQPKEVPKPSPRVKRLTNMVSHSPVADIKPSVQEPRTLSRWSHLYSKGCFHVEDKGAISSHLYTLTLKQDSNVWLKISPSQPSAEGDLPPVDMALFVVRDRDASDTKRVVTFTEQRDSKGAFSVRTDLDKGTYTLLPFTSGCRLHRRKTETKTETKLVKKDKDDNVVLTKAFKDALSAIFDMADLDDNGTLSRDEFNWFNLRTSGEEVADDEWAVVEENIELKDGELTKKGFIQLNQMEAEDNDGDSDDLWVTLTSMGFNRSLELDEACVFVLDVFVENGVSSPLLKVKSVEGGASLVNSAVCESIESKGECTKVKGAKDLSMYVYQNDYRTSIVMQNQSSSKTVVKLDCSKCKNVVSNVSLDCTVTVPAKGSVIGHHLLPKDEQKEWVVAVPEQPEVV